MRYPIKAMLLFNLFILIVGCSFNPTYHRPKVPVKPKWTVNDRYIQPHPSSNIRYMAWWKHFHDPALDHLLQTALINNNRLNMSHGHIQAAQGELEKIRYQWIPNLDTLIGYSKNPATGFPGFVGAVIPSYALNLFQQIKSEKQAKYRLAQTNAEDNAIKLSIITQVTTSYFTYQAEQEHLRLLRELTQDLRQYARIANQLYTGGLSVKMDPETIESEVNFIQGEKHEVHHNIILSRNAVRYLINQNPGDIPITKSFQRFNHTQLIPSALPLTVLENRPDMQLAENHLRAANEGIGLAASNWLPTMQLDLIAGLTSGNSRYIWPKEPIDFNDQLLKIPVFKFSVIGEISRAKGLQKVAYYQYIDTLQQALRETTDALSAHDRFTKKLQKIQLGQQHLLKAYTLNQRLYQQGIQSLNQTLPSKIALDRVNIQLNQAQLRQLLTIISLYQSVAGGYASNSRVNC